MTIDIDTIRRREQAATAGRAVCLYVSIQETSGGLSDAGIVGRLVGGAR